MLNPKKVQIIIKGTADYDKAGTSVVNFDSLVNSYFRIHKNQLNKMFEDIDEIDVGSTIKGLQFDSVEKQIEE